MLKHEPRRGLRPGAHAVVRVCFVVHQQLFAVLAHGFREGKPRRRVEDGVQVEARQARLGFEPNPVHGQRCVEVEVGAQESDPVRRQRRPAEHHEPHAGGRAQGDYETARVGVVLQRDAVFFAALGQERSGVVAAAGFRGLLGRIRGNWRRPVV